MLACPLMHYTADYGTIRPLLTCADMLKISAEPFSPAAFPMLYA